IRSRLGKDRFGRGNPTYRFNSFSDIYAKAHMVPYLLQGCPSIARGWRDVWRGV
ncbi:hypothetical protein BJV78DRAFT_1189795, partial [Lactifluus subvellereus]